MVSVATSHPLPSRQTSRAVSEILEQISCPQPANMKSRQACSLSCSSRRSEGSQSLRYGEIETDADEKQSLQGLTLILFLPLWNTFLVVWRQEKSPHVLTWQPCGTSFSPACIKAWPQQVGLLCWHLWSRGVPLFRLQFPFLEKLEKCRCSLIYS